MMKTVGLALGKYAPLHKGHQLVLDLATEKTDSQIFVIYDSPHVIDIPLRVRSNWMRELYPNAQVIEAWEGPEQVGLDLDVNREYELAPELLRALDSVKRELGRDDLGETAPGYDAIVSDTGLVSLEQVPDVEG